MKKKGNRNRVKFSYRWHRRVGILISIPAIIVAITGLVLNHSKFLNLDEIYITNPNIISWYGMKPKGEPVAIRSGDDWVSRFEGDLYINEKRAASNISDLRGVVLVGDFLVVATQDTLFLFSESTKEFVEKIGSEALPNGAILAISVDGEKFLIDTTSGRYFSTKQILNFSTDGREPLKTANFSQVPDALENELLHSWRGEGLSLWRIVLDIHSGSLFSKLGVFFADLTAICIVLLVFSGFYNWRRKPTR